MLAALLEVVSPETPLLTVDLGEQVYIAASLAKNDDPLNDERKKRDEIETAARDEFAALKMELGEDQAALCSRIYRLFHSGGASKAVGAQYLAELLNKESAAGKLDNSVLREKLPTYIVAAIDHVTVQTSEQS